MTRDIYIPISQHPTPVTIHYMQLSRGWAEQEDLYKSPRDIRLLHPCGTKHSSASVPTSPRSTRACQSWAQIYGRGASRQIFLGFKVSTWALRVQLARSSSCANLQTDPSPSQMIHNVPPRPVLHVEARWETCVWGPFTKDQQEISGINEPDVSCLSRTAVWGFLGADLWQQYISGNYTH